MLRIITKNMFDVVAGVVLFASIFYLAVITHIMPLPENASERLGQFSVDLMDVLIACIAWLTSFLPWKLLYCSPATGAKDRGDIVKLPELLRKGGGWFGHESPTLNRWNVSIPTSTTAGQLIGTPGLRNRFSKAHEHPRKANHLGAFLGVVHALREG
jgi:hypothetical protein